MKRRLYAMLIGLAIIPVGLGVRRFLSGFVAKYLGVALWATCMYFVIRTLFPKASITKVAIAAAVVSWAVELFQLTPIPRALSAHHRIFDLILGTTFNAPDLPAYLLGVALAALLDRALLRSPWK